MKKVINLQKLEKTLRSIREIKSTVALTGGCFDILHIGHIHFLEGVNKVANFIIVLLESDQTVKRLKGPSRPIHTQNQRAKILSHLDLINLIVLLPPLKSDGEYTNLVKSIKPDIIALTENDSLKKIKIEQSKLVNARLVEIKLSIGKSTSDIFDKIRKDI